VAISTRSRGFGGRTASLGRRWDFNRVKFACWGDSLTASGSGYADVFAAAYTPNRRVYNGGVGGDSINTIVSRMAADTLYRGRVCIFWDRMNSGETNQNYATQMALLVGMSGGKFLIISDINKTDGTEDAGSAWRIAQDARNAALAAAYPNNFLDLVSALDNNTLRTDGLHCTATAISTIIVPAIQSKLVALGYMNVTS